MDSMTQALKILGFAALMLSVKVLTWLSLMGAFTLFVYAMLYPSQERTIVAAAFAILVFLPSLFMERKPRPSTRIQIQPQQNGGDTFDRPSGDLGEKWTSVG